MKILVVEDERQMADLLGTGLTEEGHVVYVARTGPDGLAAAETGHYDVILLDIMLPDLDGVSIAKRLRAEHNLTPILMLTARDAREDIVRGLDAGADDYLVKPFAFDVLLARLRAVARRGPVAQGVPLGVGDLSLDPSSRTVERGGTRLTLTRTEFNLLEFLLRRAGTVVSRGALIEGVWGYDRDIEENTLDAFVRLLRQKVDGPDQRRLIHTVRGVGYTIREEPDA